MRDIIEKIADHYGLAHQVCKTKEELQELYTALLDYQEDDSRDNLEAIVTEIADVEIMTAQLKYLLNVTGKVEIEKTFKLRRQLDRVKEEKR